MFARIIIFKVSETYAYGHTLGSVTEVTNRIKFIELLVTEAQLAPLMALPGIILQFDREHINELTVKEAVE